MSRLHSRPTDEITQENARHPDFYTHSSLSLTVSADFRSISSDKGLHYRGSAHPRLCCSGLRNRTLCKSLEGNKKLESGGEGKEGTVLPRSNQTGKGNVGQHEENGRALCKYTRHLIT